MTQKNVGHYAAKHSPKIKLNPEIAKQIKESVLDGKITCTVAHAIANNLHVAPTEVGVAIDLMEVRINKCQLGLFGYGAQKRIVKPAQIVSPQLEEAIQKSLKNDRMSCLSCWKIAESLGLDKIEVSAACEALEIKISPCQIGAF